MGSLDCEAREHSYHVICLNSRNLSRGVNYSMTAILHSTISTQTVVVNFMDIVAAFVCPVFSKYSMHTYSEIINAI